MKKRYSLFSALYKMWHICNSIDYGESRMNVTSERHQGDGCQVAVSHATVAYSSSKQDV